MQDVSCNQTCSEAENRHVSLMRYYHRDLTVCRRKEVHILFPLVQTLNHQEACLHCGFVVADPIWCLSCQLFFSNEVLH